MQILVIGLNEKTASIKVRERFAIKEESIPRAIRKLQSKNSVHECVIVGTCNRTEVYTVVDQLHSGIHHIQNFFADWFKIDKSEFVDFLYVKENDEAIRHLYRVICGLDSMVLGETQILGQVKSSFIQSQDLKATGTIFNMLFKRAITLAKRAHSRTNISKNAVSVSYVAIELAKKILGNLHKKTVVILGAGEMGELAAKHLVANGADNIIVVNRTYERAKDLADKCNGQAFTMNRLFFALFQADIVISSLGAESYVATKQEMETLIRKRRNRPLMMIDIAVPRNLDPAINDLDHIFLYNLDDLASIVEKNMSERIFEAEKIRRMIDQEIEAFKLWINTLALVPVITALREKSFKIQEEAVKNIENKLPQLTERERSIIRQYSETIVKQMLHDPLIRMKEMAANPNRDGVLPLFTEIFALEKELEKHGPVRHCKKEPKVMNKTKRRTPVYS